VDLDGGDSHPDRYALPVLATRADAFIQPQVVPHHADVLQRFRPVADQRRVAHRTRQFTVLDEVALRRREDEVAAGDIHLPAAEVRAVESLGHGADDLFRIALPGHHERIRHARHRDVRIAFAPPAARGPRFQQRARKLVLQVAAQYAVLDQDVAPGRLPFVVHVERSAPAADRAIVHHGAQFARYLLSHAPAEGRDALAVEIGLQPVTHRLVQQDPRPAGPQHHRHLAGRPPPRPPRRPPAPPPPLGRASADTLSRASGCRSTESLPSLVATSTCRKLSAYTACT